MQVLKEKTDISDGLGLPDPTLAGCLAVCWLLLYLTLRSADTAHHVKLHKECYLHLHYLKQIAYLRYLKYFCIPASQALIYD